ncbi:MAG: TetR/AcrR family transcriptional regulator [Phormidesmis sp.]|mgnify:CR=1 FL=1
MARLREFDTEVVLDSAMQAFWLRGYEATSLADLMTATGLKKGSIYKAFNDKHSLFVLALKRYLDQSNACHRQYLAPKQEDAEEQTDSPKANLSEWLHNIIEQRGKDGLRRGCFMLNSLVELAPHDEDVKQLLSSHLEYVQRLVCRVIARGQTLGEFRTDIPAKELSFLMLNLLHGLVTNSKGPTPLNQLQQQADTVLKVLA